jgi:predicted enzyme related to lactoylglutathione lyase
MKKSLFATLLILCSIGLQFSFGQTLKQKLDDLKDSYDFTVEKLSTDTSFNEKYLIRFKQDLIKGNASQQFSQRVFISHRNFEAAVVFITEGYDASHATNPKYQSELAYLLNANQVCIEHRYFGESKPDSIVWKYLSVENAANDHHKIAEFVRDIYPTKIISTGISKGGQTTNFFKYFYPEDMDICVPYVAPLNFSDEDKRVYKFLANVGSKECRDRILNYQKIMLQNKSKYLKKFKKLVNEKGLTYSMGYEKAYELIVFEYPFAFWQWGTTDCNSIPEKELSASKMLNHLDDVAGFDWISIEGIARLQPFFYQAMHEIGMYGYDLTNFQGLTSYTENPIFDFSYPEGEDVVFEPELMQRVDFALRHKANNMIFIYGENDPWSSTAVEPAYHTNSFKIVKKGGSHRTRIGNLPEDQRKQVLDSLNSWLQQESKYKKTEIMKERKKVTGVGGIFFKSSNPKELNEWYAKNLGLVTNEYGSLFEFRDSDNPDKKGYLQWGPFAEKTTYFQPSEKEFMINYRVENIEELVKEFKENGVTVLDEIETYEYGKFVHIMDPEGNKIELWEPIDSTFTKLYDGKTTK